MDHDQALDRPDRLELSGRERPDEVELSSDEEEVASARRHGRPVSQHPASRRTRSCMCTSSPRPSPWRTRWTSPTIAWSSRSPTRPKRSRRCSRPKSTPRSRARSSRATTSRCASSDSTKRTPNASKPSVLPRRGNQASSCVLAAGSCGVTRSSPTPNEVCVVTARRPGLDRSPARAPDRPLQTSKRVTPPSAHAFTNRTGRTFNVRCSHTRDRQGAPGWRVVFCCARDDRPSTRTRGNRYPPGVARSRVE